MTDASAEEELKHAFVLQGDVVAQIWNFLTEKVGTTYVEIRCADRISREFTALEALLKYENPPGREIQRLYFHARSPDRRFTVRMTLRSDGGGLIVPTISLAIGGDEQTVISARDALLDILVGTKPWYSAISQQVLLVNGLVFAAVLFGLAAYLGIRFGQQQAPLVGMDVVVKWLLLAFIVFTVSILVAAGLSKLLKRLFPMGSFAIGQGKARYESLVRFQWGVLIPVLVSAAVGALFLLFGPQPARPYQPPTLNGPPVQPAK